MAVAFKGRYIGRAEGGAGQRHAILLERYGDALAIGVGGSHGKVVGSAVREAGDILRRQRRLCLGKRLPWQCHIGTVHNSTLYEGGRSSPIQSRLLEHLPDPKRRRYV